MSFNTSFLRAPFARLRFRHDDGAQQSLADENRALRAEIAEKRRAEEDLLREKSFLDALMNNLPDSIYFKDRQSRFTRVNKALALKHGHASPEDAIGKSDFDCFVPEFAQPTYEQEQEIMRTGVPVVGVEMKETRPGKPVTWSQVTKLPLRDQQGNVVGLFGLSHNITRLKRTEEDLMFQKSLLDALMDNVPDTVYFKDKESRFIRINKAHADKHGLAGPSEAAGKSDFDFFSAEHAQAAFDDEQAIIRTGQPIINKEEKETWPGRPDTWVCSTKLPLRTRDGRLLGTFGISRDITAQRAAEAARRESEARVAEIIESALDAVITIGAEGLITGWNRQAESTFGWSRTEVLGQELASVIIPVQQREPHRRGLKRFLATGEGPVLNKRIEITALHRDGHEFPVELAISVATSGEHHVFSAFIRDITDRKQRQEALERSRDELEAAKNAAEAASRAKSEFLANMSHEIRTPMNGILGMTELALDTQLDAEQRDYLEIVHTSAESLLTVINDILDFSKIEAKALDLDPIEFNLQDSLDKTLKTLAFRAHQKGLEIIGGVDPDVPEHVVADPTRLRQVLVNLIGNAIKFTERGEVGVRVSVERRRENECFLHFSVSDTGMGIARGQQSRIFDAFAQADGSTTRKYGGTGLGLSISSRLVELMGGTMWVESQVGRGSSFHFTGRFGLPAATTRPAEAADEHLLEGVSVLVVDDNAANRRLLSDLLERWGVRPALAEDAEGALKLLIAAHGEQAPFKLVLTDANMPGMDGFHLAERIQQDPRLASAIIMMLTSAGQRGDAARCRELGISAYLTKPISRSELYDALLKALARSDPDSTSAPLITKHSLREDRCAHSDAASDVSSQQWRILLAEDNKVNQALATRLLEKRGHHVTVASDGREALAAIEKQPFDLVLMDVEMPGLDGRTATALLRERERLHGGHLPVIAMTAYAMTGDREACLGTGMDEYISKPINRQELWQVMEAVMKDAARAEGAPAAPAPL